MYDVVIIGAGVIGALIARALSKYNVSLCILEKENDVAVGATKANSAIVHAGFDARPGSLKAKLNVKGAKLMKSVCQELGVKYKNNGSLVVAFDEREQQVLRSLLERGKTNGVENLRILSGDEVKQMEPNISGNVVSALYAPTGAIVCPYDLTVSAIGNAMDHGTCLKRNFLVIKIDKTKNGYRIFSENESVEARFVINCAGVYSDEIARMVGDASFYIHPRRGEYLLLDKECGQTVSRTVFRTPTEKGKGILITPTVDGNLLLGPTAVDVEDKDNKNTTGEGLEKIIKSVKETFPCIPTEKTIRSFSGLRASGNTDDFIINSPKKGFINVAGIESPGLSAAPAIAEYVLDMLKKQGLEFLEKADYNPNRRPLNFFRDASLEEKNRWIQLNPAYGRIICRCEGVTEGEILDALHRNPKAVDLDGIKRRTRAQMGRCQGGFCMPHLMEILAKELEISCENVTKSGGGSFVAVGKTKGGKGA